MSFPRHVHKLCGRFRVVRNDVEYDRALAEGWSDQPVPYPLRKGDETHDAFTAEGITAALIDGWEPVSCGKCSKKPKKG